MYKIKPFILKYWPHIALIVFVFMFVFKCNDNTLLEANNAILKTERKTHATEAAHYISIAKSLDLEKTEFIKKVSSLEKENVLIKKEISDLRNKQITKLAEVKSYNSIDIQSYVQDRYKVVVPVVQQGIILRDTVSRLVITDLVQGDGAKAELKLTQEVLSNTNEIVNQKDGIIANLESQKVNLLAGFEEKSKENDINKEIVKNVERQLKQSL